MEKSIKSGFVSIIGRPSTGKSTLINKICGHKISIVSPHPQTTQFIVRGIYNDDDAQIIFIDTPGYHNFNSDLNKGLSALAVKTLNEGDIVLYLVDITRSFGEEENAIIQNLIRIDKKIIIAYNKTDMNEITHKDNKKEINKLFNPVAQIDISAKTGHNIDKLISILKENLEQGPLYYPIEYVTDQNIPFRIQEVVREKVFNNTGDELPHSSYVGIDSLDVADELITAHAIIFVERESQKGMVIGKGGKMIKTIGEKARIDLEEIFERKVNLFLKVKVHYKWRREKKFIKKKFSLE